MLMACCAVAAEQNRQAKRAPGGGEGRETNAPRGSRQSPLRKLREATSSRPPAESESTSGKILRYCQNLVDKFDQDQDGQLNREESASLGESLKVSDFDRDGMITAEEFAKRIHAYSRRRSIRVAPLVGTPLVDRGAANPPLVGDPASVGVATAEPSQPPKPKRFVLSPERQPQGAPDWFLQADEDGDGQVLLAELAAVSPELVSQFPRFDLNNDGVITAAEVSASALEAAATTEAAQSSLNASPTATP